MEYKVSYPNTLDKVTLRFNDLKDESLRALLVSRLGDEAKEFKYFMGRIAFTKSDGKGTSFTLITPDNIMFTGLSFMKPDDINDEKLGVKKACRRAIRSYLLAYII